MVSCVVCGEPTVPDANFCTSCGSAQRRDEVGVGPGPDVPVSVDDAPTQTFELAPAIERDLTPGEEASTLVLDLQACPRCGAPNAKPRRTCGRCEAALPSEEAPDLFAPGTDDGARADDDAAFDSDVVGVVVDDDPTQPPWLPEVDDDPTQPPWRDDPPVPPHPSPGSAGPDDTLLTPIVVLGRQSSPRSVPGTRDPTGRLPVIERIAQDPSDESEQQSAAPSTRRRWPWVLVVLFGIVAGSSLGWALAADVGPFGAVAAPVFDSVRYGTAPMTLRPEGASSSSNRGAQGAPEFSIDGDPQTAWSAADDDTEPSLTITLPTPVWLTSLVLATGEPPAQGGPAGSGRIATAVLSLGSSQEATLRLRDVPQDQAVALPEPRLTDRITIRISSLSDSGPAAITELRLLGHVASASDAALLGWVPPPSGGSDPDEQSDLVALSHLTAARRGLLVHSSDAVR